MNNEFYNENNYENNRNYTSPPVQEIDDTVAAITLKPKKKHNALKGFVKLTAMGLVLGITAGASFQGVNYLANRNQTNADLISENDTNASIKETVATAVTTGTSNEKVTSDVSTVVENSMPSIVAIKSVTTNVTSDFFGREFRRDVEGSGSGIIIGQNNKEILIVTNNHVIADAKVVNIVFTDESTATATIKGTAASSDIAVVSVDISDIKAETLGKIKIATLGDSNTIKLGEMAIAIGNALGYGQSVTVGYVSALNREVTIDNIDMKLLQTDAAINPGNSGGALLNSKGEVIGINAVKYVDSSVESIGYAIPISDAIPIINELMNRTVIEEKDTAFLGIDGEDVTDVYSESFGMPIGIYVSTIVEGSAAENAGILVGDIIVSVNSTPVKTKEELREALSFIKGGSTGKITVKTLDNGEYKERKLDITFDVKPVEQRQN